MSFISVFDVMGPNMIGPSSSHTAGATRIAYLAQKMINGPLAKVEFILYGSFARTYHGHGTDRALLGGIMGFSTDDMRIRNSFEIATENGLKYSFTPNEEETDIHPNTVDIIMTNTAGQEMTIRGESLGGGKVHITQINHVWPVHQIQINIIRLKISERLLTLSADQCFRAAADIFTVHIFIAALCR